MGPPLSFFRKSIRTADFQSAEIGRPSHGPLICADAGGQVFRCLRDQGLSAAGALYQTSSPFFSKVSIA